MVITGTQCFVYNVTNLSTPIIFDFEGDISILSLAGACHVLGLQINVHIHVSIL